MARARRALIVATDEYADPRLANLRAPAQDAAQLAAVLHDPAIGDYDVSTVLNQPHHVVAEKLAEFFSDAGWEDLLVVHFSCHGVKADDGQLFFATVDTKLRLLVATAIPASFVHDVMRDSRAGSILLMLDCCYAGAFAKGMAAKAGGPMGVFAQVVGTEHDVGTGEGGGTGHAVITASDDMQFAFEDGTLVHGNPGARPSVFTKYVVQGLRTGEADRDQDGQVTLTEFYGYVHEEVVRANRDQTPKLFTHDIDGNLFLANRTTPATRPTPLDEDLQADLTSLKYWVRLGAVEPLVAAMAGKHPGRALAARLALEELSRDPDDRVKAAATAALRTGTESTGTESTGTESTGTESTGTESTGTESTGTESTGTESTGTESTGTETTGTESTGTESTGTESTGTESTGTETTGTETTGTETTGTETTGTETTGTETTGTETTGTETTGTETSQSVPWWRRLRQRTLVAVSGTALVLVILFVSAAFSWWPGGENGGDGTDPTGDGSTDGSLVPLDENVLLLSHANENGIKELVAVDTDTRDWAVVPDSAGKLLPAISRDRDWAIYMDRKHPIDLRNTAHVVGPDGTDRLLLGQEASQRCPYTSRPAWSPNGTRLAAICVADEGNGVPTGLVVIGRDGTFDGELLHADDLVGAPSWGENGLVYFTRDRGGTKSIWAVPGDGSAAEEQVTGLEPGSVGQPDWSPNGLLYLVGEGAGDVWVLTPQGTSVQITTVGTADSPNWSPDRSTVAWLQGEDATHSSLKLASYPDGEEITIPDLEGDLGPPSWSSP